MPSDPSAANSGELQSRHSSSRRHDSVVARDYIAVARGSDLVVIRVVGHGNMHTAQALADFADAQRSAGFRRFVFDLERCQGMDSTFVGVMVGIHTSLQVDAPVVQNQADMQPLSPGVAAAELASEFASPLANSAAPSAEKPAYADGAASASGSAENGAGQISAVNVPPEIQELLMMLGADRFIKLRGACDLTQLETTILAEKNQPPEQRRRLILRAHEMLVEIDKRNLAQFGQFLQLLSSELAKDSSN
ncbi:MAG TPA: STAS domain-containing protein [Planctomycetota bacterium]|jgi:hypothetical protein